MATPASCSRGVPLLRTLLRATPTTIVPSRSLQIFPAPPPFKNVNMPEKFKLPVLPKVPHIYTTMQTK